MDNSVGAAFQPRSKSSYLRTTRRITKASIPNLQSTLCSMPGQNFIILWTSPFFIDCPEKRQPFGNRAKQFTSDMVFGKIVEVEPVAVDRYGRTVAFVRVANLSVNEELIKEGLAWIYARYCKLPLCVEWQGLQLAAQAEKLGLWGDSNQVPPWEIRRYRRKSSASVVSLHAN